MACRPAGMSDDESEEDDIYFGAADGKKSANALEISKEGYSPLAKGASTLREEESRREAQELEFRALQACLCGDLKTIEDFVKGGRNVNDFLHTGWTLLLYGATSAQAEVLELLLKLGAKPNKSKDGFTALMVVCDSDSGSTEDCLKCVRALLKAKANPNMHDKFKKTALMFACSSRDVEVVAELVKHVKSLDDVDCDGRTALHYAAAVSKRPETVRLLLEKKATATITDRSDMTPRDIALAKGNDEIAAIFDEFEGDFKAPFDSTKIAHLESWRDMFPAPGAEKQDSVREEIAEILSGMGLDCYRALFKDMQLETFLKLDERDLEKLGIDVSLHRKQFLDNLHKFHAKPWSIGSVGAIKRHLPYTLYDGVAMLGNAARQLAVIGSSFEFVKKRLKGENSEKLSKLERSRYSEELEKTEKSLRLMKQDLVKVLAIAKKADKDNRDLVPADYIAGEPKKSNKITIFLGFAVFAAFCVSKNAFFQRFFDH